MMAISLLAVVLRFYTEDEPTAFIMKVTLDGNSFDGAES